MAQNHTKQKQPFRFLLYTVGNAEDKRRWLATAGGSPHAAALVTRAALTLW